MAYPVCRIMDQRDLSRDGELGQRSDLDGDILWNAALDVRLCHLLELLLVGGTPHLGKLPQDFLDGVFGVTHEL